KLRALAAKNAEYQAGEDAMAALGEELRGYVPADAAGAPQVRTKRRHGHDANGRYRMTQEPEAVLTFTADPEMARALMATWRVYQARAQREAAASSAG
ncbi:hypothetical protein, partial [Streptomyces noursei]